MAFRNEVGGDPIISPSIVQRLDVSSARADSALFFWHIVTATAGARATFYSNSLDPMNRSVLSRNLTRGYGEFELDVRPPALAKNFHRARRSLFLPPPDRALHHLPSHRGH